MVFNALGWLGIAWQHMVRVGSRDGAQRISSGGCCSAELSVEAKGSCEFVCTEQSAEVKREKSVVFKVREAREQSARSILTSCRERNASSGRLCATFGSCCSSPPEPSSAPASPGARPPPRPLPAAAAEPGTAPGQPGSSQPAPAPSRASRQRFQPRGARWSCHITNSQPSARRIHDFAQLRWF